MANSMSEQSGVIYSRRCLTPRIAWAAATDAGNRAMCAGGRTAWSEEDRDIAHDIYERLAREGGFHFDEDSNDPAGLDRLLALEARERALR